MYKKIVPILILFIFSYTFPQAQSFLERSSIGVGFGGMKYMGDLTNPYTKFAGHGTFTYELTDHINLRGQLLFGSIGASDASTASYQSIWNTTQDANGNTYTVLNPSARPHPFNSRIQEVNALVEYNFFSKEDGAKWTPYVMAGLGYFNYYAKYTYYNQETNRYEKVGWLRNSRNINIPLGGGIKYFLNDNITLYGEGNFRYTRLDDVDGLININNSKSNDYFYSLMVGITFRLGGDYSRNSNKSSSKGSRKNKSCPPVYL